jgi:hypothetical protein
MNQSSETKDSWKKIINKYLFVICLLWGSAPGDASTALGEISEQISIWYTYNRI